MEELLSKHRKEQRDLQSRVTQKRKQASKKTRKGVNEECDCLEADLKQKQADEIAAFNGEPTSTSDDLPIDQLDDLTLQRDENGPEPTGPLLNSQQRRHQRPNRHLSHKAANQTDKNSG
jgi:OTU domain-containing protein 6